jgi:hypothetical protein
MHSQALGGAECAMRAPRLINEDLALTLTLSL